MHPRTNFKIVTMYLISSLMILGGTVLFFCDNLIFNTILKEVMTLKPNSYVFDIWKKTPLPVKMDFYFFNWTNPEDIYNTSIKPRFEQVGPYRFKESKEKVNITWNNNNTVSFKHLRLWYLDENSPNNATDLITTLNVVALSAAHKVRTWNYILRKGFSTTLSALISHLHVTKSVQELLFEGYEDTLLNMARTMPFLANEGIPDYDKFGWFYTRNGSYQFDGTLNMANGVDLDKSIGELLEWNFQNRTRFFEGNCAKIRGSAGELFPPVQNAENISIFSTDMCQNIPLEHEENDDVNGIIGKKFTVGPGLLDNGTIRPENACYCNGECVRSGLVNVSACRYGSPAFMSLPNFYKADPYYVNQVDGMRPEKKAHEFFITLEPRTGIPLEVAARLQLNLLLQPVESVSLFSNLQRTFFPVLWFEQTVILSDDYARQINLFLLLPTITKITATLLVVVGLGLFLRTKYLSHFKRDYALVHRGKVADVIMDGMYS